MGLLSWFGKKQCCTMTSRKQAILFRLHVLNPALCKTGHQILFNIKITYHYFILSFCTNNLKRNSIAQNNSFAGLAYNLLFKPSGFFCYLGSKTSTQWINVFLNKLFSKHRNNGIFFSKNMQVWMLNCSISVIPSFFVSQHPHCFILYPQFFVPLPKETG